MGEQLIYTYSGGQGDATSLISNLDNLKYIFGEDGSYEYLVASRSVYVDSSYADFGVASVGYSAVSAGRYGLCNSNSDVRNDNGDYGSFGIRPIVVLPSDIEVEKNESGQWDIAY